MIDDFNIIISGISQSMSILPLDPTTWQFNLENILKPKC